MIWVKDASFSLFDLQPEVETWWICFVMTQWN